MNPRIKLTKLFLIALAACAMAFQSVHAQATVTATLTNVAGGGTSISIAAGGTFTLSLGVTTNFLASGYSVFYQSPNGAANFMLVSRTNTSPIHPVSMTNVFNDVTTTDAQAFGGNAGRFMFGPTGISNQFDLGYTGDAVNQQPGGTFTLQNITIMVLASAPNGSYTIRLDPRSSMTDRTGGGFDDVPMGFGTAGSPLFTVNVIPEPATVGLAVVGGALVLVGALHKRRT
jgi:hypothetical protein